MTNLSPTFRIAYRGMQHLLCTCILVAQGVSQAPAAKGPAADNVLEDPVHIFYLTNVTNQNESGDLSVLLRNMVNGRDRIFFLATKNAIVLRGSQEDIALAQHLITELDRPKKVYKLTYTLAEMDNGKRVGIQHFDVVVLSGQKVVLKQGSKVPIVTGASDNAGKGSSNQFTYLDVGINIDAEVIQGGDQVTLKTKVERSSVAEEASAFGAQDPVIRQALVEAEVNLQDSKPLIIGSMDIVGTTRHIDVNVVAQTLP